MVILKDRNGMHRFIIWLARVTAILGGFVLIVLVALTTLSIIGRILRKMFHSDFAMSNFGSLSQWLIDLGVGEINGNYELLEAGVAFAIFSFFPICQLYNEHATVDVFTSGLSTRALSILRAFWEVVLSLTIIFVTWRLYEGMQRYIGNGETTLFLQMPLWWSYAASFTAACVACIIAAYCAIMRVREAATGHPILSEHKGSHNDRLP
jgi:TRAP-type C4-dicarboxylate transport system permease small subunit